MTPNYNQGQEQENFSFIVIPDTQMLAKSNPGTLRLMARRIIEQFQELNIQMVLHLGDVVNNGAADEQQFEHAKEAFEPMLGSGLPLLVSIGNHDYDNMLAVDRNAHMFNKYFGLDRIQDKPWFGGALEEGKAENVYAKLDIGGTKFLFFALEFGPRDFVMQWVCDILDAHPDHQAIIITHSYMYMFGNRTQTGDDHNPKIYKGADGAIDGEGMWMKWLSGRKNLHSIYSGHHIFDNVSYRIDRGDHGNLVFQSFQNWQFTAQGGEGRYRIVTYDRAGKEMTVRVYNPLQDCYESQTSFVLSFPLEADETTLHFNQWEGWETAKHPK